jgi:hypothetical protein
MEKLIDLKSVKESLVPNLKLIEELKYTLKEAEEGRLRSFIGAGSYNNGDTYRLAIIDRKQKADPFALMGALHSLILTIDKEWNRSNELTSL